jgi:hypothetical protein
MHCRDRGRRQRLQYEIAVRHGIERIGRRSIEAKRLGGHVAVDRKRRPGERRRPEGRFIQAPAGVRKPPAVARRHFHIGQQMMSERYRLCGLQMREPRHYGAGMLQRLFSQRALVPGQRALERIDGVAHPQLEVSGHLVVARACGMQPAGRRPDQLGQPAFDIHVNVFQRALEFERAGLDL